jgi:hypothetical protein
VIAIDLPRAHAVFASVGPDTVGSVPAPFYGTAVATAARSHMQHVHGDRSTYCSLKEKV